MAAIDNEIRLLLYSDIPGQISKLEESSTHLEKAAAYCEASYFQSNNKDETFNETKKLTLQSLASVAYYVNSLSAVLLRLLDLQAENFVAKTSDVQNINQLISIQREKMARREIGKLTINKSIIRQNKITYPITEEKTPRYQRTPIEYSLLDGVGHGRQLVSQQQDYTTPIMGMLNRSGSIASNDYATGNYNNSGAIYDHYASRAQTLTRNSMRSVVDQYRVPQVIPSALAQESIQQQRFTQLSNDIYHGLAVNELNYATADSVNSNTLGRRAPQNHLQLRQLQVVANPQYRFSNDSMVEGLPPPPLMSVNPHPDDPLPPPPALENNYGFANWIPATYIEKARVVYDYEAGRADELSLSVNSIVYVLRKNEDGWFEGVLDGITGLFPGNYVEPI